MHSATNVRLGHSPTIRMGGKQSRQGQVAPSPPASYPEAGVSLVSTTTGTAGVIAPAQSPGVSDRAGNARAGEQSPVAEPPEPDKDASGEGCWVLDESRRNSNLHDAYEVPDKEMGRGHYGIVRRGVRRSDGAQVAVKTIPKRRMVYIDMLKNEINILRAMDNANIIQLLDEFEDEKQVHLVFELCSGGELFEPIADQGFRFTERQASRLVRKMLCAVKHIHDRNYVHRDLKPENLLLTAPGVDAELKIIDFGLATSIKSGEMLTKHVGTPYYIAPEVLNKNYGKACDVWSIGVIMFTLLCGFPPFWGDTEREIYGRVRRGYYAFEGPDWASRSVWSKDLIQKLLTLNPAKRFSIDEALAHHWIVYEGEVIDPRSRRIMPRVRRFCSFPWLKRKSMAMIARTLTESQLSYAKDMYDAFTDRDAAVPTAGGISGPQFVRSLTERGATCSPHELLAIHAMLDTDGDGLICFHEMAAVAISRLMYLTGGQIMSLFNVLDVDQDGIISLKDLMHFTRMDTAVLALSEGDLSSAGGVTLGDFSALVCGNEHAIL